MQKRKKKSPKILSKRPMILMEVMIALAIVALCVLPIISPHAFLLVQQKKFISTIELDHAVNLIYVDVLERLHKNEIPWQAIHESVVFPVDDSMLRRMKYEKPLPFKGVYQFVEEIHKTSTDKTWGVYLINLHFSFTPNEVIENSEASEEEKKGRTLNYHYTLFIENTLGVAGEGSDEEKKEGDKEKPKEDGVKKK